MTKYIIGTGWWCDGSGEHLGSQFHKNSYDEIRKKEFFRIWYHFVNKYTNPEKIIVVDSASPLKPDFPRDDRVELLSLRKNFGHSCESLKLGLRCGAERAIMGGAFYSYLNDVDFIYIEQDCLVKGKEWVERCMKELKKGKIMYGDGKDTPQPQQQSLVIVKRDFIPIFIARLINEFNQAVKLIKKGDNINKHSPESCWHKAFKDDVNLLPFGYGRARPINFNDKYLYAQQWTEEELDEFLEKEGIKIL